MLSLMSIGEEHCCILLLRLRIMWAKNSIVAEKNAKTVNVLERDRRRKGLYAMWWAVSRWVQKLLELLLPIKYREMPHNWPRVSIFFKLFPVEVLCYDFSFQTAILLFFNVAVLVLFFFFRQELKFYRSSGPITYLFEITVDCRKIPIFS